MTVAVCLKCGAMKHGAWTPCPKCRHTPQDPEDKAKHMMTSDHYFSKADLESISTRVQGGLPLSFDPKQIEQAVNFLKNQKGGRISAALFVYGFFTIIAIVIVVAIYLITRFFAGPL